jgi:hypothetical protein
LCKCLDENERNFLISNHLEIVIIFQSSLTKRTPIAPENSILLFVAGNFVHVERNSKNIIITFILCTNSTSSLPKPPKTTKSSLFFVRCTKVHFLTLLTHSLTHTHWRCLVALSAYHNFLHFFPCVSNEQSVCVCGGMCFCGAHSEVACNAMHFRVGRRV